MKFVQTEALTYWWPMQIPVPHPSNAGQWKTETFRMKWRAVGADRIRELEEQFAALKTNEERTAHQDDQILEAACDWSEVIDGDGEPIPFSPEMLLAMMNAAIWYRTGIYDSYNRSLRADAARRGN